MDISKKHDVCVVGLGYIGLPTAVFFSSSGLQVLGVDINKEFVEKINLGNVPFVEPGLGELLEEALAADRFSASVSVGPARSFVLAVPTPFKEGHQLDSEYLCAAAVAIAPVLTGGELIVVESTSPPGTTEMVAELIIEKRPDLTLSESMPNSIYFAHCPERVLPGRVVQEMEQNDRIIGGLTPKGTELAFQLYSTFCKAELLKTNAATAEMAKLTENAFRDVNIAFANELSLICEKIDVDVWELIELANHHPRVNILQPGPGVGGHCIAVDPWFIVSSAPDQAKLIKKAREVNDSKPGYVCSQTIGEIERTGSKTVAILGLAFKADIDDLRESPAVAIARQLCSERPDVNFLLVEPNIEVLPSALALTDNATLCELDVAVDRADIILILVDHRDFSALDEISLESKTVIDTRGFLRSRVEKV